MSITSPEKEEMHKENSPLSEEDGEVDDHDSSPAKPLDQDPEDQRVAETPAANPALPSDEEPPPLPVEAPPAQPVDDGWEPIWDDHAQAFYFFNRFTKATQWENPRVPETSSQAGPPGVGNHDRIAGAQSPPAHRVGGYDPAIHGDYDPNADYAKAYEISSVDNAPGAAPGTNPADVYAASGTFNRFTGKWQRADLNPEKFTDEQKSRRQMNAFFDVDAAANSHDGRSLRAERANKKLSKAEVKAFKEKRREKKEEKRRAWLRD
ncbi:uncharacterized protein Z520_04876 [Fonsecaea multimorphosa CBS 102226]|uniref:WW domain-containing protein n=1 Tax=Fonsecaea multimorphosa CBS 102226 TaxID=1442371 RepID=A0A0D2HBN2_9EURO|nr:uncharacterized protein Z520_04876 [Fonsecaea multimorphosa CBS 102226]KIX99300.1 hypothetical protein Z520_04876 [Fonsecaea multimorphosa CBS 102226]OAL25826.1 hypothetical protein AYO22_04620 [Fonsecaea multimorphosa]